MSSAGEPVPPVSRSFIALYTLAQIGAFAAFVPLLQILVPLKALAIDPAHGAALLSRVALLGALTASLANLAAGALSDRSRNRHGSRRRWLLGGFVATLCAYAAIWCAATPGLLIACVMLFQLAFNALFAPLGAVLADLVPNRQKGIVSAFLGLGYPLGGLAGTLVVGTWVTGEAARYAALAALVGTLVLPFAWRLRDSKIAGGNPETRRGPAPGAVGRVPDFVRAWLCRLLVVTALSLIQGYMLFYLESLAHGPGIFPGIVGGRPEAALAQLIAIATAANIAASLACGWLSDRVMRRKPFVLAGALVIASGILGIATASSWAGLERAMAIYGLGAGCFYAVDMALIVEVLPSDRHAGKDLGLINLSNTLPQAIAPALAMQMLQGGAADYTTLFFAAALCAAIGGTIVLGIKSAR